MNKLFILFYVLFCMNIFACTDKPSKEETHVSSKEKEEEKISLKDSLLNTIIKERRWSDFCKLDEFGIDTILYKRHDSNNNFVGLLDLKEGWNGEICISSDKFGFFPKTMRLCRSFEKDNNKIIVFKAVGMYDESLISCSFMDCDTLTNWLFFKGEIAGRNDNEIDKNIYVRDVKVKIDNIPMKALTCINDLGINVLELRGLDGTLYGEGEDISNRKRLVDKIRKGIVDKIVEKGAYSFFEQIPNVDYYVNEGRSNAMRFNDKYRNNSIDVYGIVKDIDEPWGSRYKYRVKLEGCNILTDNRSVLSLNKGDYTYMRGICSNFDSNSYQLTIIDGFVLTNEHAEDFVRTMMNRTEEVLDDRLISIGDYNIYFEDAIW